MERKKKKGLGILAKLTLMCALPIICADVILAVYSINALQNGMKEKVMEGLSLVCQSVSASYDAISFSASNESFFHSFCHLLCNVH